IWFPTSPIVLITSAILLGIAVSPIWVIMLASVDENNRGKQMGYVYFSWLLGLLVGMVGMNLIRKFHPICIACMMLIVVLTAWILYYFAKIRLINDNTIPVNQQIRQTLNVTKRQLLLFPLTLLPDASASGLSPRLLTYAKKVVG